MNTGGAMEELRNNLSLIRGGIYDGKGNFIMTIPDMGTSGIEFKTDDDLM
ncbi:hypothetical protein [Treponema putidum]|nr:hypothetical protein [Treponema putidum]